MGEINFEVLIPNESLYELISKKDSLKNKYLLTEINNYEDGKWRYERFNDYMQFKENSLKYVNFLKDNQLVIDIILNDYDSFLKHIDKIKAHKKDDHGLRAIDYARRYNRLKMVEILKDYSK